MLTSYANIEKLLIIISQDQISGLNFLNSQVSKSAQICTNRVISWVSNFHAF